jgi:Tfp pilus assembly protein PilX
MKTHLHYPIKITPSRQEGAVLITSLILLVIITMLGVSGIEGTKLETRMAANTKEYNMAFQIAQSGIEHTFRAYERDSNLLSKMPDDVWLVKPPNAKPDDQLEKLDIGAGRANFRVMKSSKQVDYGSKVSRYYIIESTGCTTRNCNNGVQAVIVGGLRTEQAKDPDVRKIQKQEEFELPLECDNAPNSAGCTSAIRKVCSTSFSPNKCRMDLETKRQTQN